MAVEPYYRPTPESNAIPKEAVLAGFEYLPRSIVLDVVANNAARDMLPRNLRYLTSPDFLASNALISVSPRNAHHHLIEPFSYGRATPIGYGFIPFANTVGSTLTGKGSWLGGDHIRDVEKAGSIYHNHSGLLSVEGARFDTIASNALIENGFRSALHTGYAILDQDKLRQWIQRHWPRTAYFQELLEHSFDELQQDGELPSYLYRIGGSTERVVNNIGYKYARDHRIRAEMAGIARMFLFESEIPGSQVYSATRRLSTSIRSVLEKVAQRKNLSDLEYYLFKSIYIEMLLHNAEALPRAIKRLGFDLRGDEISAPKDTDLALFSYDYDTAIEYGKIDTGKKNAVLYLENANILLHYLDETLGSVLAPQAKIRTDTNRIIVDASHTPRLQESEVKRPLRTYHITEENA